jgi:hypothetical protein
MMRYNARAATRKHTLRDRKAEQMRVWMRQKKCTDPKRHTDGAEAQVTWAWRPQRMWFMAALAASWLAKFCTCE